MRFIQKKIYNSFVIATSATSATATEAPLFRLLPPEDTILKALESIILCVHTWLNNSFFKYPKDLNDQTYSQVLEKYRRMNTYQPDSETSMRLFLENFGYHIGYEFQYEIKAETIKIGYVPSESDLLLNQQFSHNLLHKLNNPDDVPDSYILINKIRALHYGEHQGIVIKCKTIKKYLDFRTPDDQLPTDMDLIDYYAHKNGGFVIKCNDGTIHIDEHTPADEMPADEDLVMYWFVNSYVQNTKNSKKRRITA